MVLTTDRLILRPIDLSDAPSVYGYAKDPDVGPSAGWRVHTSVENSREIIRDVLSVPETYAICLREDNEAIGTISLLSGKKSNIDMKDDECELGFWLGKPFWGKGIVPEAAKELIRHAFEELKVSTVWCGYFEGNEKSKRVQEKCGFAYAYTKKDIYWEQTDEVKTEHITVLTKEKWKAINKI